MATVDYLSIRHSASVDVSAFDSHPRVPGFGSSAPPEHGARSCDTQTRRANDPLWPQDRAPSMGTTAIPTQTASSVSRDSAARVTGLSREKTMEGQKQRSAQGQGQPW